MLKKPSKRHLKSEEISISVRMYNQNKKSNGYAAQYLMKKTCDVTQGQSFTFLIMSDPYSHSNSGPTPVNSPFWFTPRPTNHHPNTQYLGLGLSFSLEATFYFLLVFLEQNGHLWIEKRGSGQEIKLFTTIILKVLIKIKIYSVFYLIKMCIFKITTVLCSIIIHPIKFKIIQPKLID